MLSPVGSRVLFVALGLLTIGIGSLGILGIGFGLRDSFCDAGYWPEVRRGLIRVALTCLPTLGGLSLLAWIFSERWGRLYWLWVMPAVLLLLGFGLMLLAEYGNVSSARDYCAAHAGVSVADSEVPMWRWAVPAFQAAMASFVAFAISIPVILVASLRGPSLRDGGKRHR